MNDDATGSLDKPKVSSMEPKLSPALIVEESPVNTPLVLQSKEDNQSIGKFLSSLLYYIEQIMEIIYEKKQYQQKQIHLTYSFV